MGDCSWWKGRGAVMAVEWIDDGWSWDGWWCDREGRVRGWRAKVRG